MLDALAPSGTADLVRHLVARLDRRHFAPEVLALRAAEPRAVPGWDPAAEETGRARLAALGAPAASLVLDGALPMRRRLAPFVAHLRERRIDVVHAHSRPADLWAVWGGVAAETPVRVYSRQATYGGLTPATRARYALTARAASSVVAVSEAVREHLRSREGVPARRIALIHDAVDVPALAAGAYSARIRAAAGIPRDAPLVGTAAALTARKGVETLVAAADAVWRRVPSAHFVVLGEGPERATLERRIAESARPGAFHLLGFRSDFAAWIGALDVFVLPSQWEGFNLSLLSACALGRAVVATHLRAHRELVEPGVSGLLPWPAEPVLEAPPAPPEPFADAITRLLLDPALRARLGAAARRRVAERFDAAAMTARHEALYARLLREAGAARPAARRLASALGRAAAHL